MDYTDIYKIARDIIVYIATQMSSIPVLEIEQFHYPGIETSFYANTIRAHLYEHRYITTSHKYNFYSSFLITKGSGTIDIDFNSYPVRPGFVFFISPGQVHSWNLSADIEGCTIFHSKEFYNQNFTYERIEQFLFFGAGNSALVILNKKEIEKIEFIFSNIIQEYKINHGLRFQKICSLLNVLYIELSQLYLPKQQQTNKNENQQQQLRLLENLIDKNYKNLKFAKQYAGLMNMSPKHLNRIVKSNLNKTTSTLISDRVMLEAKRMLIHSGFSVSQIALELGYLENGYFFRVFKNKTGKTPTEFMKEFRKN